MLSKELAIYTVEEGRAHPDRRARGTGAYNVGLAVIVCKTWLPDQAGPGATERHGQVKRGIPAPVGVTQ